VGGRHPGRVVQALQGQPPHGLPDRRGDLRPGAAAVRGAAAAGARTARHAGDARGPHRGGHRGRVQHDLHQPGDRPAAHLAGQCAGDPLHRRSHQPGGVGQLPRTRGLRRRGPARHRASLRAAARELPPGAPRRAGRAPPLLLPGPRLHGPLRAGGSGHRRRGARSHRRDAAVVAAGAAALLARPRHRAPRRLHRQRHQPDPQHRPRPHPDALRAELGMDPAGHRRCARGHDHPADRRHRVHPAVLRRSHPPGGLRPAGDGSRCEGV
ncbi:MAG: hypothetical protein AVDCRST_MAG50-2851, partial [uncultured Acidimicrobiales bacterium]